MFNRNSKCRLAAISLAIIGLGSSVLSNASPIEPGYDLFKTTQESFVDLSQIGCPNKIMLQGYPAMLASENFPGPVDTIVQRKQGINPFESPNGVGTIDIELVAMALKSKDAFDGACLGLPAGTMVDLYVTVNTVGLPNIPFPDGTQLNPSTGQMTIKHEYQDTNSVQGTFTSTLDVNSDLIFVAAGSNIDGNLDFSDPNNLPISMPDPTRPLKLSSTGYWRHKILDTDYHNAKYPAGKFYITEITHTSPQHLHSVITSVELVSFTATPSQEGVTLNWKTAFERDNAGFHIFKAKITDVSQVTQELIPAKGNLPDGTEYTYVDKQLAPGIWVYVLVDIDTKGKASYHLNNLQISLPK